MAHISEKTMSNDKDIPQAAPVAHRNIIDASRARILGTTVATTDGREFHFDYVFPSRGAFGNIVGIDSTGDRCRIMKLRGAQERRANGIETRILERLDPSISISYPTEALVLPGTDTFLDGYVVPHDPRVYDEDLLHKLPLHTAKDSFIAELVDAYRTFLCVLIRSFNLVPVYGAFSPLSRSTPAAEEPFLQLFNNLYYNIKRRSISVRSAGGLLEIPPYYAELFMEKVRYMVADFSEYLVQRRRFLAEQDSEDE